jgi:type I restriction enzyme M protein
MSERITENLTKKLFLSQWYEESFIEEQKSQNPIIDKLLQWWSKKGNGKSKPEFIISLPNSNTLIVVECKPYLNQHESKDKDKLADFAVDWVLYYWAKLSREYNVIAIAVSWQTEKELKISNFLFLKWEQNYKDLEVHQIMTAKEYDNIIIKDPNQEKKNYSELLKFSRELHNNIRDYAKLDESQKPLFVSGVLIALKNWLFKIWYKQSDWKELQKNLYQAICNQIDAFNIPGWKKDLMKDTYKFLEKHPNLEKNYAKSNESVLKVLVKQIESNISAFFDTYNEYDIIWSFYWEFLRYTGGDKQGLWIVLTPKHITELFVEIARVNVNSKVFDPCCGTWWFLISAMKEMLKQANWDTTLEDTIKAENLIGIEQNPNMYTLGCSNMILRWDGKANIYQWDCFDEKIVKEIVEIHKPNVGFINPPYSQKWEWQSEMEFVEHMLDMLEKNWTWIAIVPMSCALTSNKANNEVKSRILKKHTLKAVLSMPDDLFYPVWTVTCIMVFSANNPHNEYIETRFWYSKDDWFEKTKTDWRIDKKRKYEEIKIEWLKSFFAQSSIPWLSITKHVEWNDEWCAEAYMETDYSTLNQNNFIEEMKKYVLFKQLNN